METEEDSESAPVCGSFEMQCVCCSRLLHVVISFFLLDGQKTKSRGSPQSKKYHHRYNKTVQRVEMKNKLEMGAKKMEKW